MYFLTLSYFEVFSELYSVCMCVGRGGVGGWGRRYSTKNKSPTREGAKYIYIFKFTHESSQCLIYFLIPHSMVSSQECTCFPEFFQNFSECQILWSLCLVVFLAFTLRLPIQTSLCVAPKFPVSLRSTENCQKFRKTSTPHRCVLYKPWLNSAVKCLCYVSKLLSASMSRLNEIQSCCN